MTICNKVERPGARVLSGIFVSVAVVGAAHYGITGFEDALASAIVGAHAGFGALAYDVYRTIKDRTFSNSNATTVPKP